MNVINELKKKKFYELGFDYWSVICNKTVVKYNPILR